MIFQCNAMRFVCYAMGNWIERLKDMVCYAMLWCAMRFEKKHLHTQKSFKHFEVKW